MGVTKLVVSLDKPVYHPGQTLSGRLLVTIDEPMPILAIHLEYSGKGSVYWPEISGDFSINSDGISGSLPGFKIYWNCEEYLALRQLLFGDDAEECELAGGEHVFNFEHQLPMNLPNSFEGAHGSVRYFLNATIEQSSGKSSYPRQPVKILSDCDLNHIPLTAAPWSNQKTRALWGQSKPVSMTVNLPVRGFVPGQTIAALVSLNNESKIRVKSLSVSLVKNVTFYATSKSRTSRVFIFKDKFPVPNGLGLEEVPINFKLPSVPASYLEFCKIINVSYELHIKAKVNGWHRSNLKMKTEIIVGTIPLTNFERLILPEPISQEHVHEENPSHSKTLDDLPPGYGIVTLSGMMAENLPPQSYQQSDNLGSLEKKSEGDGVADLSSSDRVHESGTNQG